MVHCVGYKERQKTTGEKKKRKNNSTEQTETTTRFSWEEIKPYILE